MAFIHLKSQTDVDAAIRRSRNMMGNKKVSVVQVTDKNSSEESTKTQPAKPAAIPRPWELKVINLGNL